MRLVRYGAKGAERPGMVDRGGRVRDLSGVVPDIAGDALLPDTLARLAALDPAALPLVPGVPQAGLRLGPCVGRVGKFVCIGLNYADHAAEAGMAVPPEPVIFGKWTSSICGPDDDVELPRGSVKTDWEVELGVVIGRTASYLDSTVDGLACVAGYVAADDLSEREFQLELSGGQWSKGKCCPGFTPLGPWLVTADELDPQALGLRSWVNGEPRQDSSTADQLVSVGELVRHLSQFMTLEPGDLLLTGTPEGVALSGRFPYLEPGDVVEIEIDGLGRQRQECVAWEGGPSWAANRG